MEFEIEIVVRRSQTRAGAAAAPPSKTAEEKIGKHVRQTMVRLASEGKLSRAEVTNLVDRSYCKTTFRLSYPFLRKVVPNSGLEAQRLDERGYGRFWREPLEIDGSQFLVCSQWFAWQRPAFDRWVLGLG